MITKDDFYGELRAMFPTFESISSKYDDQDRELLFNVAGDFAHHLLEMKKHGNDEILSSAGEFIERMLVEGDQFVRELATIGILEGIQNTWGWSDVDRESFRPFLGKLGLVQWDALNDFWNGRPKAPRS